MICLCGGIATGKSTVAEVWKKMGLQVIRADKVGHRVLELPHIKRALEKRFGPEIFERGMVNRKALGEKVFSNPRDLLFLNRLTHPEIKRLVEEEIRGKEGPVVLEAALLFEIGLDSLCDLIVCTYCSRETQIERLVAKGFSLREARARTASQRPPEDYAARADLVINTEVPLEKVREQAEEIVRRLKEGKWVLQEAKWK